MMQMWIKFFSYYTLLFFGLIGISWIIWSRFIRERTIKNIPDEFFTEYHFWLLFFICSIYIYIIKNYIKENKSNLIPVYIINAIWKPLITLDHAIKYNKYSKELYYKLIRYFINCIDDQSNNWRTGFILVLHVIPRLILITFLLIDTFYFNKLEIFYKIILIGILPFIYRYIEYSIKDIYDHFVNHLAETYNKVTIFEKGYEYDISRLKETEAVWHFETVTIEEYIEIMYDTPFDCILENTTYEYVGDPFCAPHIYEKYEKQFNKPISSWTFENFKETKKIFEDLMPEILNLKLLINNLRLLKKEKKILWTKIGIFSLYLLCWGYILIISYYNKPIELTIFTNILESIMIQLTKGENPFTNEIYILFQNFKLK